MKILVQLAKLRFFVRLALTFVSLAILRTFEIHAETPVLGVQDVRNYEIKNSGYSSVRSVFDIANEGGARWIDDNQILFMGFPTVGKRTLDGFPQAGEPLPQLYLWNVDSHKVTAHNFDNPPWGKFWRGRLCVYRDRVRFIYEISTDDPSGQKREMKFEGKFGKERLSKLPMLSPSENQKASQDFPLNYYTCEQYRSSELPKLSRSVKPLLYGDYVLRDYKDDHERMLNKMPSKGIYAARNGKRTELVLGDQTVAIGRYFRYLDSYIVQHGASTISEHVPRRYGLLDRNGILQDYTPPSGPWMNSIADVVPTKRGMFVASRAKFGSGSSNNHDENGAAGGYLLNEGRLVRLIAGIPQGFDISPNGCRIVLSIADQNEDGGFNYKVKTLDVCAKGV